MGVTDFINPFEAAALSRTHAVLRLEWPQDFSGYRTGRILIILSKMSIFDEQNHRIYTANKGGQLYIRLWGYDQLSDLHVNYGIYPAN
jgi:hypothetical protein